MPLPAELFSSWARLHGGVCGAGAARLTHQAARREWNQTRDPNVSHYAVQYKGPMYMMPLILSGALATGTNLRYQRWVTRD